MLQGFDLGNSKNFLRRTSRFKKTWNRFDLILWGVPIFLVALSSVLIASTQRHIGYVCQSW